MFEIIAKEQTDMKKLFSLISKDYVFLTLLFVIGLLFLPSYGAYLDQNLEQKILYSNILSYCEEFHAFPEFCEYIEARDIIRIQDFIDRDHGICVFYPLFFIWKVQDINPAVSNFIWHFYIYLLCFAGIVFLYLLTKELFGKKTAVLTTLFFFLTPRIFAEIHYNNKDTVILTLSFIVFYLGYRLKQKTTFKNAVLFGLIGAVISNMKIIGLFIWGIIGLWVLFSKIAEKEFKPSLIAKMLVCFASAILLFAILTPAFCAGPIAYMKYQFECAQNYRWDDALLFAGKIYVKSVTGFTRKYLPLTILMTLPVSVLLLSCIGTIRIVIDLFKKDKDARSKAFFALAAMIAGFFPLVYAAYTRATVYNGWRHFYFSYASAIVILSFGVDLIVCKFKKKHIGFFILSAVTLSLFAGIVLNHPYQYTYYNFPSSLFVKDNFELDYWDVSFKQALQFIGDRNDGEVNVACLDNPSVWGVEAQVNNALSSDLGNRIHLFTSWKNGENYLENAEYIIVNPTYSTLYSRNLYSKIQDNFILIKQIHSYGNVICEVYQAR